jgi:hypothetical protein
MAQQPRQQAFSKLSFLSAVVWPAGIPNFFFHLFDDPAAAPDMAGRPLTNGHQNFSFGREREKPVKAEDSENLAFGKMEMFGHRRDRFGRNMAIISLDFMEKWNQVFLAGARFF